MRRRPLLPLDQDNDASDEDDSDDAKKGFLLDLDYEAMSCEHTLQKTF